MASFNENLFIYRNPAANTQKHKLKKVDKKGKLK